jgi:hypothetical protein
MSAMLWVQPLGQGRRPDVKGGNDLTSLFWGNPFSGAFEPRQLVMQVVAITHFKAALKSVGSLIVERLITTTHADWGEAIVLDGAGGDGDEYRVMQNVQCINFDSTAICTGPTGQIVAVSAFTEQICMHSAALICSQAAVY